MVPFQHVCNNMGVKQYIVQVRALASDHTCCMHCKRQPVHDQATVPYASSRFAHLKKASLRHEAKSGKCPEGVGQVLAVAGVQRCDS